MEEEKFSVMLSSTAVSALEQILGRFLAVTRTPYPGPGVSKEEIKRPTPKSRNLLSTHNAYSTSYTASGRPGGRRE
jgi:hypothetical protein